MYPHLPQDSVEHDIEEIQILKYLISAINLGGWILALGVSLRRVHGKY